MKGIPEWFPIIGEKKRQTPSAPDAANPFTPTPTSTATRTADTIASAPSGDIGVDPTIPTMVATETPQANTVAAPTGDLESSSGPTMTATSTETANPSSIESPSISPTETPTVSAGPTPVDLSSAADTARGMAANINAFPGTGMNAQPQETPASAPTALEDKPAA